MNQLQDYHNDKITLKQLAAGGTQLPFPGVGGGFRSIPFRHLTDAPHHNSNRLFRFGVDAYQKSWQPSEQPSDESSGQPSEESTDESSEQPSDESSGQPSDESSGQPPAVFSFGVLTASSE